MAALIAGLLERDKSSGERWLSFTRPPPPEIRRALLRSGWHYHRGLRAWFTALENVPIPPLITVAQGHDCDYSRTRSRTGSEVLELLARTRTSIQSAPPFRRPT